MRLNSEDIGCEVTIDGTASGTYYTNCDNVKNIGPHLENYGNSSITLYRMKTTTYNSFNPYISIQPYKYPRYYNIQTSNPIEITNITTVTYNDIGYYHHYKTYLDTCLIFAVFVIMLLKVVKNK